MSAIQIMTAVYIGLAYAAWSIVGRASGASGAWMGMTVMLVSIAIVGGINTRALTATPMPAGAALLMLIVAGLANGVAIHLHSSFATDPNVPTGAFVTTIFACMIVSAPLISYVLLGEGMSLFKTLGVGLIITGIVFMSL